MKRTLIAAVLAPFFLVACITPVPYVDPKYDAAPVTMPAEVKGMETALEVEFYTNGKRKKAVDKILRKNVVEALTTRGVSVVDGDAPTRIRVAVDNLADLGDAAASGFGTGLTLGLAGSTVSDFYKADIRIERDGQVFEQVYDHAIHTTIGRVNEPPIAGVQPYGNVQSAFSAVISDVVDQALFDFFAAEAEPQATEDDAAAVM